MFDRDMGREGHFEEEKYNDAKSDEMSLKVSSESSGREEYVLLSYWCPVLKYKH